ncbi:Jag N-terminal domain-containing protein [Candidatus Dependentiae bacterium]|nr:Jag N-terminal domain-containing protein [Candidatus Dependentiae bacterium]
MKSVIAQGSTIAKAIEDALKKADMPQEFFVKVLEDAQTGFLGFGSKKAKIALFFKDDAVSDKNHQSMFEKGSYAGLFNSSDVKKQLDQQLKELGLEIKPLETKKQENKSKVFKKDFSAGSVKVSNLQVRPLVDKNQTKKQSIEKTQADSSLDSFDSLRNQDTQDSQQAKSGQGKHKRYYHYRRNRYKNRSNPDQNKSSFDKLDDSSRDE